MSTDSINARCKTFGRTAPMDPTSPHTKLVHSL